MGATCPPSEPGFPSPPPSKPVFAPFPRQGRTRRGSLSVGARKAERTRKARPLALTIPKAGRGSDRPRRALLLPSLRGMEQRGGERERESRGGREGWGECVRVTALLTWTRTPRSRERGEETMREKREKRENDSRARVSHWERVRRRGRTSQRERRVVSTVSRESLSSARCSVVGESVEAEGRQNI
jgi:hypothetical protein